MSTSEFEPGDSVFESGHREYVLPPESNKEREEAAITFAEGLQAIMSKYPEDITTLPGNITQLELTSYHGHGEFVPDVEHYDAVITQAPGLLPTLKMTLRSGEVDATKWFAKTLGTGPWYSTGILTVDVVSKREEVYKDAESANPRWLDEDGWVLQTVNKLNPLRNRKLAYEPALKSEEAQPPETIVAQLVRLLHHRNS